MAKDVALVRIKADTNDYERNIKQAQKTWDSFTKGLGANISKFTGVGAAIGAVSGALKVAKDAFMQSETNMDKWGQTVEGAKGAYSTFLNTLNSGNWSNFFSNLSTAVQGARDLYDSLDRLGSIKSNNQAAVAIVQQQIAQLRVAKQQGQNVDDQLKEATARLAALQKQAVDAGMGAGHDTIVNTLRNRVNALNRTGVNISDGTLKGYAGALENYGQQVFDNMAKVMTDLQKKATVDTVNTQTNQYGGTTYTRSTGLDLSRLTQEEQKQYYIAKAITEGEAEIQQGLALYAQAVNEGTAAAREEFKGNRYALQGSTGSGGSGKGNTPKENPVVGSIDYQIQKVKELQDAFNQAAEQGVRQGLLVQLKEAEGVLKLMKTEAPSEMFVGGAGYGLSQFTSMDRFKDVKIDGKDLEDLQELANAGKQAETSWDAALGSISGLGSALAAIEDPAVKVLGIIAQAIATVALSFAQALSKDTKLGVFGWIAAAAAGTAAMFSTISAIKSATAGSYAEGGIVPGNSFSGDNLTANVNSGELILNRAQQNTLAAQLRQQNSGNKSYQPSYVSGEQIWVAMNRYLKRSGQGEVLTWKS